MKTHRSDSSQTHPQWSELLRDAVTKPGSILEAYTRFHGYSLGNRIAALWQCSARGIQPGPIATFPRWIELGRHVKRGERALVLCQPVTVKDRDRQELAGDGNSDTPDAVKTLFIWRPRWFVLAQTDGAELAADAFAAPAWEKARALSALEVSEAEFREMDGNVQGYARGRSIAINPLAQLPLKTLFHELGHVIAGHTARGEATADTERLSANIRECEAEAIALLCLESLQLPGGEFCRGYIQHWYGLGNPIPEHSAQRIFKAADTILRAGSYSETPAYE
jgi:N-terminal domain of anti-restriction factor ArdC